MGECATVTIDNLLDAEHEFAQHYASGVEAVIIDQVFGRTVSASTTCSF